jgi:O-antigen/teichoic acid export membrane protein
MNATKRLAFNSACNVGTSVLSAAISFCLLPVVLNSLGESNYGVWVLIGSVFNYSTVLSLGLNSAINREIPIFIVKGEDLGLRQVTSTAVVFFIAVGLLCVAFTGVLYSGFTHWFSIPPQAHPAAQASVLVVGLMVVVSSPLQPFTAVLSGYQRYDLLSVSRVVPLLARTALILTLLRGTGNLFTLAAIFAGTEFAVYLLNLVFSVQLLPAKSICISAANYDLFRRMLAYGVNTFLYIAGAVIMAKSTELLLGVLSTTDVVARYSVASSAVFVLCGMVECFCGPLKPMASNLHARGKRQQLLDVAFAFQKLVLLVTIPAVAFMVVMGKEFLLLWTHKDMPQGSLVLGVLAIGYLFRLSQYSNFLVLVGVGEHRIFGVMTIYMALTSVLLSSIFVLLGWGITGAALGNMMALAIFGGTVLPRVFRSKMHLGPWQGFARCWRPAIVSSMPAIVLILIWKVARPPQTWLDIGVGICCVAMVVVVSCWKVALLKDEKAIVYSLFGRSAKAT